MESAARTESLDDRASRGREVAGEGSLDAAVVVEAIRRFQAGEEREASFRTLFERYHPNVERFFVRRTASVDRSLDLTQETFLRVYKGLDGYRWQAPFGAWVFRIAWNVLKTSATRAESSWPQERQVALEEAVIRENQAADGDATGAVRPAYVSVLRQQQRQLLMRAVERLPPQRRRCIVLWAYHQLTYEQIGVALRISIGTVKAHMSQARRQLGELLDELLDEPNDTSRKAAGHG